MTRVTHGPSPFGDWDAYQNFKRATKKQQAAMMPRVQRQLQSGWNNARGVKPNMRTLTSSSGSSYQVPEDDYQDYMTFYRSAVDSQKTENYSKTGKRRDVVSAADYIDYAFGKNTRVKPIVQEGCGHIALLEYAPYYQILKVTFANNGSVVAFFRVPKLVASTLISLAQSKNTRHDGKHVLGIYFWDLVRIRGTVHGSRYKFEYVIDNSTGNLPGRPYGSGKNLYTTATEIVPDKETEVKIKALQEEQVFLQGMKDLMADEQGAEILKDILAAKNKTGLHTVDVLAMGDQNFDDNIAAIDAEIAALEARTVSVPRADSNLANVTWGNMSAFNRLTEQQMREVQRARLAQDADEQQKIIDKHNALRRAKREWTADDITELAEALAGANMLGNKVTLEMFNTRFPNATEQFNYFKSRHFIPDNSRFINS